MKTIYYATKLDKLGNKITIGYQTEKNRDKFSKGASFQDGVLFADFNKSGKLAIFDSEDPNRAGGIMHGMLVNNSAPLDAAEDVNVGGDYVLYGKRANVWAKTPYNFPTYTAASSAMKAMIGEYQALLVRFDGVIKESEAKVDKTPAAPLTIGD